MNGAILRRYSAEVQGLGRDLSISARQMGVSTELMESLDRDRPDLGTQPVRSWADQRGERVDLIMYSLLPGE